LVGVEAVPLNFTVLEPCVVPKFIPAIDTEVPTGPEAGDKLVMLGVAADTAKLTPLLATAPTVTTTFPVVAPLGTGAMTLVAVQLVGVAAVPLNFTVLVPWVVPKFIPAIVTEVPTDPDKGDRLVMFGVIVKFTPLLATPPAVTTTLPLVAPFGTGTMMLVALQLVTTAEIPLNVTVPVADPKLVPAIVTGVPTVPEAGDKLAMVGDEGGLPAAPVPYIDAGQLCQVKAVAQVAGSALSPVLLPTLLQAVPSSRKWTTLPFTPSRASQ